MRMLKKVAVILMLCLLVGCSAQNKEVLFVYNWGDYIDEEVLAIFEDETGIEVQYEWFNSNENMYSKIKAGGNNYDILIPSDYMVEKMINEDMLLAIDFNNIPNYEYTNSDLKDMQYDPQNAYSVPYMWGTVGIVYNKTMVPIEVDSWQILWDEQYDQNIIMYDSQRDSIGVALKMLGYSLNERDPQRLEEAKNALIDQKPLVLTYSGDDIKRQMITGVAALAVMYSGDALVAQEENPDLAYVVPEEGSNIWVDAIVIPKECKNKENAELFINFLCRPDIALKNTLYIGYSTPNTGAFEQLPQSYKEDITYSPPAQVIENCETFKDLGEFVREYDRIWTEVLAK